MKSEKNIFFYVLLGIIISLLVLVSSLLTYVVVRDIEPSGVQKERRCREYELEGILPKGSCDCVIELFGYPNDYDTWEKSYDWMDACAILEIREK